MKIQAIVGLSEFVGSATASKELSSALAAAIDSRAQLPSLHWVPSVEHDFDHPAFLEAGDLETRAQQLVDYAYDLHAGGQAIVLLPFCSLSSFTREGELHGRLTLRDPRLQAFFRAAQTVKDVKVEAIVASGPESAFQCLLQMQGTPMQAHDSQAQKDDAIPARYLVLDTSSSALLHKSVAQDYSRAVFYLGAVKLNKGRLLAGEDRPAWLARRLVENELLVPLEMRSEELQASLQEGGELHDVLTHPLA